MQYSQLTSSHCVQGTMYGVPGQECIVLNALLRLQAVGSGIPLRRGLAPSVGSAPSRRRTPSQPCCRVHQVTCIFQLLPLSWPRPHPRALVKLFTFGHQCRWMPHLAALRRFAGCLSSKRAASSRGRSMTGRRRSSVGRLALTRIGNSGQLGSRPRFLQVRTQHEVVRFLVTRSFLAAASLHFPVRCVFG